MSAVPHVFGAATFWIDTGSGLTFLGVTVDGAKAKMKANWEPVMTDAYFKTAIDYQYSPPELTVEGDLVYWDETAFQLIAGFLKGLTSGQLGAAGSLVGFGSYTHRLLIKSTPVAAGVTGSETCLNIPLAFLEDNFDWNMGTERTIKKCRWKALPAQNLTASSGQVLWNTTST